jgi:hypothetical protein
LDQETSREVGASIEMTILRFRRKSRRLVGILSRSCLQQPQAIVEERGKELPSPKT